MHPAEPSASGGTCFVAATPLPPAGLRNARCGAPQRRLPRCGTSAARMLRHLMPESTSAQAAARNTPVIARQALLAWRQNLFGSG